jgi:hypothetical protein
MIRRVDVTHKPTLRVQTRGTQEYLRATLSQFGLFRILSTKLERRTITFPPSHRWGVGRCEVSMPFRVARLDARGSVFRVVM